MASSLFPVAQELCFLMPFDVGDKVVYPHHGAATI